MNFIASMRMLLGATELGPNAVMKKLINDNLIIPAKQLASSGSIDRDEALDNIEEFEKLIKSNWFDEKIQTLVGRMLNTMPTKTEEELVSEFAYKLVEGGWSLFEKHFSPNHMNALEFVKYYTNVMNNLMRDMFTDYNRLKKREKPIEDIEGDEDDLRGDALFTRDPIWQQQITPMERAEQEKTVEYLKREMLKYIAMKDPDGKHGIYYALILVWMDETLGVDVSKVDVKNIIMKSPIVKRIAEEEGLELFPTIYNKITELKLWILEFFERRTSIRITDRFKRWLKVSSEQKLAMSCKRIAEFVLLGTSDGYVAPEEELEVIRSEMKKNKENGVED